jgi:hypothetical protein
MSLLSTKHDILFYALKGTIFMDKLLSLITKKQRSSGYLYIHPTGPWLNALTPELNPSAQRCLPRFLLGILILKGSLRDVFISRSALKG